MATIEYWIQLENHPWDVSPNGKDPMTGRPASTVPPVDVQLKSLVIDFTQTRKIFKPRVEREGGPLHGTLLLRRYTKDWHKPDDRKQ